MSVQPPTANTQGSAPRPQPSPLGVRFRDWAELCRLPNVFTAIADPLTGALVMGAGWRDTPRLLLVLVASACFYAGGVVLNDWNDYRRDLVERPQRPLPSKRIARWRALLAAVGLLSAGQLLTSAMDTATGGIGLLLVVCIVLYDVLMKHIPIAPALMGTARSLNLLLGMSIVSAPATVLHKAAGVTSRAAVVVSGAADLMPPSGIFQTYLAVALGLYVLGLTIFARREAGQSRKDQLILGASFAAAALFLLAFLHLFFPTTVLSSSGGLWLVLLAAIVGYNMIQAILTPAPARVQRAVKTAVWGIILFDAAVVAFRCELPLSLLVALLLIPTVWLGRWLYST